jgi:hypothetical protein
VRLSIVRAYYALGGQAGMIGQPASAAQFRQDNMVAVVILLVAAVLPLAAIASWRSRLVQRVSRRGARWWPSGAACMRWSMALCGC